MLISELAKMVHDNAVEHGWWEDEREAPEIIALIHSEWSEALEEARAGRPLVYYACTDCDDGPCTATPDTVAYACGFDKAGRKPEGIAVELIDGCIRILDYIGFVGLHDFWIMINADIRTIEDIEKYVTKNVVDMSLPELVARLHWFTSESYFESLPDPDNPHMGLAEIKMMHAKKIMYLLEAIGACFAWLRARNVNPNEVLIEKHEYNKTRPYKHGKRF